MKDVDDITLANFFFKYITFVLEKIDDWLDVMVVDDSILHSDTIAKNKFPVIPLNYILQ